MSGIIRAVRSVFESVSCPLTNKAMPIKDRLLAGLAIFTLKYPSLLKYDEETKQIKDNLKNLFDVDNLPSDTYMRERLDEIDPKELHTCFTNIFRDIQRSKYLEAYQHFKGHYLVSIDGTGYFSSKTVHCEQCCTKEHRDGSITYQHQILQAAIVHPNLKQVIPFAPEPIIRQHG